MIRARSDSAGGSEWENVGCAEIRGEERDNSFRRGRGKKVDNYGRPRLNRSKKIVNKNKERKRSKEESQSDDATPRPKPGEQEFS